MKKTGIITFHFVNNVGGILQCVGLQKQLEKTGTEARIIDYCPRYHASKYSSWHPVFYRMFRDQQLLRRKGAGGMARLIRGIKMIIGGMQANLHYFRNRKRRNNEGQLPQKFFEAAVAGWEGPFFENFAQSMKEQENKLYDR